MTGSAGVEPALDYRRSSVGLRKYLRLGAAGCRVARKDLKAWSSRLTPIEAGACAAARPCCSAICTPDRQDRAAGFVVSEKSGYLVSTEIGMSIYTRET
jgi:hypothetical protein